MTTLPIIPGTVWIARLVDRALGIVSRTSISANDREQALKIARTLYGHGHTVEIVGAAATPSGFAPAFAAVSPLRAEHRAIDDAIDFLLSEGMSHVADTDDGLETRFSLATVAAVAEVPIFVIAAAVMRHELADPTMTIDGTELVYDSPNSY